MSDTKTLPHILHKANAFDIDFARRGEGESKRFEFHDPATVVVAFDPSKSYKRFSVYLLHEDDTTTDMSRHLLLTEAMDEYERLMKARGDFSFDSNQKAMLEYEHGKD